MPATAIPRWSPASGCSGTSAAPSPAHLGQSRSSSSAPRRVGVQVALGLADRADPGGHVEARRLPGKADHVLGAAAADVEHERRAALPAGRRAEEREPRLARRRRSPRVSKPCRRSHRGAERGAVGGVAHGAGGHRHAPLRAVLVGQLAVVARAARARVPSRPSSSRPVASTPFPEPGHVGAALDLAPAGPPSSTSAISRRVEFVPRSATAIRMRRTLCHTACARLSGDRSVANFFTSDAGWSSQVARRAHNPKVAGSNPAPATHEGPATAGPSSSRDHPIWAMTRPLAPGRLSEQRHSC